MAKPLTVAEALIPYRAAVLRLARAERARPSATATREMFRACTVYTHAEKSLNAAIRREATEEGGDHE